jgi:hypothetical protein
VPPAPGLAIAWRDQEITRRLVGLVGLSGWSKREDPRNNEIPYLYRWTQEIKTTQELQIRPTPSQDPPSFILMMTMTTMITLMILNTSN